MLKELYDIIKKYFRKMNIPIFNYIFILEIILIIYLPNKKFNLFYWNNIDIGNILYHIGQLFYGSLSIWIIFLPILIACILAVCVNENWLSFLNSNSEYIDGTTHGFSLVRAVKRLMKLSWIFIHQGWIIYVAIILAIGKRAYIYSVLFHPAIDEYEFSLLYWLFMTANGIYTIWTIFYATGAYVIQTDYVRKGINVKEIRYLIIDQSNEYLFVKDQILTTPVFYLVKSQINGLNFKYKIIDFSKKFEEIKYEYEAKVRDAKNTKI